MGATNEIKGTNISLQLDDKICSLCQQPFTKEEINDRNYNLWFDTTNDVRLIPMEELKNDSYYKPCGRTGYELTIWIRSIEHRDCPTVKECQKCYTTFLEEKMIETEDSDFYCQPCYKQITNK